VQDTSNQNTFEMSDDDNPATKKSEAQELYLSKLDELRQWVKDNPWQTLFHVVNGVVFFAPWTATSPILVALGFGSKGPIAGTWAFLQ
jgi:hypothetical protein